MLMLWMRERGGAIGAKAKPQAMMAATIVCTFKFFICCVMLIRSDRPEQPRYDLVLIDCSSARFMHSAGW